MIPEMLMYAPGAVPGEVGGVVVGVGDVVSVVGIGGVLERLVVAGRRVEVVVDGEADVAQVAPRVRRRKALTRHRRYLARELGDAPRHQLRREGRALEKDGRKVA